jgi:hypothetical protein
MKIIIIILNSGNWMLQKIILISFLAKKSQKMALKVDILLYRLRPSWNYYDNICNQSILC